jgi:hypothetical protein
MGIFTVAAGSARCAKKAGAEAKTAMNAKAAFTEVFDTGKAPLSIHYSLAIRRHQYNEFYEAFGNF